jgi:hypothetical protein
MKEQKDEDELCNSIADLNCFRKDLHDSLSKSKEDLVHLPHQEVLDYTRDKISAGEKNTIISQFYLAFRDIDDADQLKFECMEILAYMGIPIYKEEDFVPYTDDTDESE